MTDAPNLRLRFLVPRRIKLIGPFWLSINLNKYPYSYCANPHVGFFWSKQTWDKGAKGWIYEFPKHWKFWDLELNKAAIEFREKLNGRR